jgi:hypothetical protein
MNDIIYFVGMFVCVFLDWIELEVSEVVQHQSQRVEGETRETAGVLCSFYIPPTSIPPSTRNSCRHVQYIRNYHPRW